MRPGQLDVCGMYCFVTDCFRVVGKQGGGGNRRWEERDICLGVYAYVPSIPPSLFFLSLPSIPLLTSLPLSILHAYTHTHTLSLSLYIYISLSLYIYIYIYYNHPLSPLFCLSVCPSLSCFHPSLTLSEWDKERGRVKGKGNTFFCNLTPRYKCHDN